MPSIRAAQKAMTCQGFRDFGVMGRERPWAWRRSYISMRTAAKKPLVPAAVPTMGKDDEKPRMR